mmetsp:Transcript_22223/g.68442  ORF Transcript_22223/g.68442 Transcript_22223/m.68442 type:complete len:159 (-) Transcript_22223:1888-2364(-)
MSRARPNILITGTPGSGKTTLCEVLAAATGMEHVNVGDVVRTEACHELLGVLEPRLEQGNVMLDFHSCDVFPAELLDLVLVLRVSTENLFDRLTARGYHQRKINENMECEIMQVVLEDAREAFPAEMVHVVENNNVDEMEANGARVEQWLAAWLQDHA